MDKQKLKDFLKTISTPEEVALMDKDEKLENIEKSVKGLDFKESLSQLRDGFNQKIDIIEKRIKGIKPADYTELLEAVKEMSGKIGMIKLQERIDKESPMAYKLMIEQLSGINDKVGGWKYPQYAYTGLRNKSFSPIDPATDGLGIGSYDAVLVTYPIDTTEVYTFKASGLTVATVTVVYTDNTKSTLLTVTRT